MNQNTTIGRIVNFHPNADQRFNGLTVALAAIIVYVHSDNMVNLTVFGPNGDTFPVSSVNLLTAGSNVDEQKARGGSFAVWPQYQVGMTASIQNEPKVFNAQGQVSGPGTPQPAGDMATELGRQQDEQRAVITQQDQGLVQTRVDGDGIVQEDANASRQDPFGNETYDQHTMPAGNGPESSQAIAPPSGPYPSATDQGSSAGVDSGRLEANDRDPMGHPIDTDAPVPDYTGGPVLDLKAPEEVTGANIHGLGPDIASGPNPDYNPDA